MRDRLVELLNQINFDYGEECVCACEDDYKCAPDFAEFFADHLLAEGIIVPPYKPMPLIDEGDRVLCPICETDLMGYYIGYDNEPTVVNCYECGAWIDSTKAVDREEAEKALAERSENGK